MSLSLGHGRKRLGPLQLPPVLQPEQNAHRAERLSIAGCYTRAPDTSAVAHLRERRARHRRAITSDVMFKIPPI